jgi:hypothetical protein
MSEMTAIAPSRPHLPYASTSAGEGKSANTRTIDGDQPTAQRKSLARYSKGEGAEFVLSKAKNEAGGF